MNRLAILTFSIVFSLSFIVEYSFAANTKSKEEKVSVSFYSSDEAKSLPETELIVFLLSTFISPKNTKVILKNPVTEEVRSYKEGEDVDFIGFGNVKVNKIYPCMVVIETSRGYEKLSCKSDLYQNYYFKPYALWGYTLDDPEDTFINNSFETKFDDYILNSCSKYDVDPHLVKAIIKAESNFDPIAVSPKNAEGLMQLIPGTAENYGVNNSFDPSSNIDGGVRVLRDLLDYFKDDINLAVAAYNAGKFSVIKHGNTIPPYPETQTYVKRVMVYYETLKGKKL